MDKLPIRLLQYIINMTNGIDQLHMKMTCKKYRLKLYITKPKDIIYHLIKNVKEMYSSDDFYEYGDNLYISLEYVDKQIQFNFQKEFSCYNCGTDKYYYFCDECRKGYCDKCYDTKCDFCGEGYCKECDLYIIKCNTCNTCKKQLCEECYCHDKGSKCNICNEYYCVDCLLFCNNHENSYCKTCKPNMKYIDCNGKDCYEDICTECSNKCNVCKKLYCELCIILCELCNRNHCIDCIYICDICTETICPHEEEIKCNECDFLICNKCSTDNKDCNCN